MDEPRDTILSEPNMRRSELLAACWLIWGMAITFMGTLAAAPSLAVADDFRIQTRLYFDEKQPPLETITVFRAGLVYDFLSDPDETTIFDAPRDRFIVMDPARQVKAEIALTQVDAFLEKLRVAVNNSPKPFAKFLADPKFEAAQGESANHLVLTSDWMVYKIKAKDCPNPNVQRQYRQFSDRFAVLNSMMDPGRMPPFARLAVNHALTERNMMAEEVRLTLYPQEKERKQVQLRTEHLIRFSLLEEDHRRLDRLARDLATFRQVSLEEYHRPKTDTAQK